jgi:hypothetical protein
VKGLGGWQAQHLPAFFLLVRWHKQKPRERFPKRIVDSPLTAELSWQPVEQKRKYGSKIQPY